MEKIQLCKCMKMMVCSYVKSHRFVKLTYIQPIQCKLGSMVPEFCCMLSSACTREASVSPEP